jgi:hypothetical protein
MLNLDEVMEIKIIYNIQYVNEGRQAILVAIRLAVTVFSR